MAWNKRRTFFAWVVINRAPVCCYVSSPTRDKKDFCKEVEFKFLQQQSYLLGRQEKARPASTEGFFRGRRVLLAFSGRMGLISDGARWGDIGWSKMGSSKEPPDYELEPTDQEAGKARYTGQSVLLGVDARFVNISDFNVQPPLGCPSIEFHGEAQDVSIKCLNYLAGKDFMFELPSTDLAYHYRSKNLANRKDLSLTLCAREKTTTYPQFFSIEGSKIFVKKEKFRDPPIPSLVAALCLEIFPSQLYSIIQWTENGLSTCRARKFTTVRVVRR